MKKTWFKIQQNSFLFYPNNLFGWFVIICAIFSLGIATIYFASCQSRPILDILFFAFPYQAGVVSLVLFLAALTSEIPTSTLEHSKVTKNRLITHLLLALIFLPITVLYYFGKNYFGAVTFVIVFLLLSFVYQYLVKFQNNSTNKNS